MSCACTYPDTLNRFNDTQHITLEKILQAIAGTSGGAGGLRQVYTDRRPAPPDNVTISNLNIDSATGTIQVWTPNAVAWA